MSGTYTLTNFQDYLLLRLGNNSAWSAYLTTFINIAYRRLCTSDRLLETKEEIYIPQLMTSASATTVDGTAYVAMPSDCLTILHVFDETNDRQLDWITWADYIARTDRGDTSSEGEPVFWNRYNSSIYLYPTPDDAYTLTVYYKKSPAALSGAGDVTVLGPEWDDVILELAHHTARMWGNEPEKAKISLEAAKEMIAAILRTYRHEERDRREVVRPDSNTYLKNSY